MVSCAGLLKGERLITGHVPSLAEVYRLGLPCAFCRSALADDMDLPTLPQPPTLGRSTPSEPQVLTYQHYRCAAFGRYMPRKPEPSMLETPTLISIMDGNVNGRGR
jgi:hypothetical protein